MNYQLFINRANIIEATAVERPVPEINQAGQILCKVDRVALTANNITYAVIGDAFKYWEFFPSNEDGQGVVPVWGFADVVASNHAEISVGERLYGYWPLAGYLLIEADKVSPNGLKDVAAHRQPLNGIYNRYNRVANDPGFAPELEAMNALLRPMFSTSFLLDDYLWESVPSAKTFIISSASSKTGYGTAYLLHTKRENRGDYEIVGCTSAKNVEFVKSLGIYDHVLSYAEVDQLPNRDSSAAYADFSGNASLRKKIHHHYGDQLIKDVVIGVTDWTKQGGAKGLPGAAAEVFFAPSQMQKRQQEWGIGQFVRRLGSDFASFIELAATHTQVETLSDLQRLPQLWADMAKGDVDPSKGIMIAFK